MKHLLFLLFPLAAFGQQWKPQATVYAGAGSFMLQTGIEAGAEYGRATVAADLTYYIQGVASVGAKVAVKSIYLDTYENEYVSLIAGWTRYNYYDGYLDQKFKHQSAIIAVRWTNYNTIMDMGWKDGGVFFTVGWQFRKINR
jgi:hypothetical protein